MILSLDPLFNGKMIFSNMSVKTFVLSPTIYVFWGNKNFCNNTRYFKYGTYRISNMEFILNIAISNIDHNDIPLRVS